MCSVSSIYGVRLVVSRSRNAIRDTLDELGWDCAAVQSSHRDREEPHFGVLCSLTTVYQGGQAAPTAKTVGQSITRNAPTSGVDVFTINYSISAAVMMAWRPLCIQRVGCRSLAMRFRLDGTRGIRQYLFENREIVDVALATDGRDADRSLRSILVGDLRDTD
jgi:hypothetical protein